MTAAEYLDPKRFPLTTQKGLSLEKQMMIDAINRDDARQDRELGKSFTAEETQIIAELEEKATFQPSTP